jgi:AraC family transcriptional regulator
MGRLDHEQVELDFRAVQARAKRRKCAVFAGISAELVAIPTTTPFEYAWRGKAHYLALHDLDLKQAATCLDGAVESGLCDLRDRMTFIPAGGSISGWSVPKKRTNSFIALYIDPAELTSELAGAFSKVELSPLLYFENTALLGTMQKLRVLLEHPSPASSLHAETLSLLAVLELLQLQQGAAKATPLPKSSLSRRQEALVREYIDAHLHEALTLSELAGLTGLSRFHFARAFKVSTGLPPHQFVLRRRIERARALLSSTNNGLSVVAAHVGLTSPSQLTRAFKRLVGVPAGEFRRTVQRDNCPSASQEGGHLVVTAPAYPDKLVRRSDIGTV